MPPAATSSSSIGKESRSETGSNKQQQHRQRIKKRNEQQRKRKHKQRRKKPNRPFPFFQLPRELRDIIYDYSLTEIEIPSPIGEEGRRYIEITAVNVPGPNILLVNRQFSEECLERAKKSAYFAVLDDRTFYQSIHRVPKALSYIHHLELSIYLTDTDCGEVRCSNRLAPAEERDTASCCTHVHLEEHEPQSCYDALLYCMDIDISSVAVSIYHELGSHCCVECHRVILATTRSYPKVEGLVSLKVYGVEELSDFYGYEDPNYRSYLHEGMDEDSRLWLEWNPRSGEVKEVETLEEVKDWIVSYIVE